MPMPVVSQKQRAAMYSAASGHSTLGIPASVGAEFVASSHGLKHLPKRAPHDKPKEKRKAVFGSLAPTQSGHYDGDVPE